MKRNSSRPRTKNLTSDKVNHSKQRAGYREKNTRHQAVPELGLQADHPTSDETALEQQAEVKRIKELPKEIGVMLITAGFVGLILPGPGTPALIAGGLALWPKAFDKLDSWLARRHPTTHHESMKQIDRFLDNLERRYPYSSNGRGKR